MKKRDSKGPSQRRGGSTARGTRAARPAPPPAKADGVPPPPRPKEEEPPKREESTAAVPPAPVEPEQKPAPESPARPANFPVVGIGASAGGLEALEQFLKQVPAKSGMAFVVVQHLDPTHKGAMVELLQRWSAMPVVQVKDRQKVETNSVYVIPPNKDMSILHGVLHLLPLPAPRGLNLPIDFFFRSLAEDQQERSVGVILSGMGSDGTLGLRAIKEKAGASFVQSLDSAKFDGMPRSAIEAGLADVIAPSDQIFARIAAYHQHAPYITRSAGSEIDDKQQSAIEKVLILLRAATGNDFTLYKRSTIYRRIERRMGLHQIDKIGNYVRFLRENPREIELLFKELLIGVTSFFRDPPAWEHLEKEVLPTLVKARAKAGVLRAWVPGCSTGEEAYSLAIVLTEVLEGLKIPNVPLQIFATDMDRDAVEKARLALYPTNIAQDVSADRLRRYFLQDDRGFRVRKEIREAVVFAPQNIIMDPPFTKLDILSCRNLLIYLAGDLQKKLIPLFHYALNPDGILFLGSAETIGASTDLFVPLDGKTRIYRRLETAFGAHPLDFPPSLTLPAPSAASASAEVMEIKAAPFNIAALADRVIVQRFAPATVLTNDKGDILYISGRTGKFLEPAVGKANLNVFAMAREGLHYELSTAFAAAQREEHPVEARAIKVATNGHAQSVDLTVHRLSEPKELRGMLLIAFVDVPTTPEVAKGRVHKIPIDARLVELERELQHARQEIQTTREEMQTSQEELKSTNEELQSTNEELQSTNEELTTSKEEMQSMNEELQTVNHELQSKVDELSRSSNDMKNLLNSTDIATLFLDGDLNVRRFTTQTSRLIKLIPADAGRPITDIATELDYPELAEDAREVLRTLVFREKQVGTRDGRWFSVRILPYRTLDNVIDGVVITFADATATRLLEATLREQASHVHQLAESVSNLVWSARADGAWDYLSHQWVEYTGATESEQLGFGWLDRVHPEERERVREGWKAAVRSGGRWDTEFRLRSERGAYRWFKARSVSVKGTDGIVTKWYGACADVDEAKQAAARLASILEGIDDAFVGLDDRNVVTDVNSAAERLLERPRKNLLGKRVGDILPPAAAAAVEENATQARRERRVVAFETAIGRATTIRVKIRVAPYEGGVSLFWPRPPAGPAPGRRGEP